MSDQLAEAALRRAHAFPGFTLLAAEACGIPASALTLDVLAERTEALEASAKYTLRAMLHGIETVEDLQLFLGLEQGDAGRAIATLLEAEYLTYDLSADGGVRRLELTPAGRDAAGDAQVHRPTSTTIQVVYDRLATTVTAWRKYALRHVRQARSDAGRILLPPASSMLLRAADLNPGAVAAILDKRIGEDVRILGINAVTENPRFYYDATLLVYKDSDSDLLRLGVEVDGQWSEAHTTVLDKLDAVNRLGLSAAPVVARYEPVTVPGTRLGKTQVLAIRAVEDGPDSRAGRDRLDQVVVRWLGGYEHPHQLDQALSRSQRRLLIASPSVTRAVVDELFVSRLEALARTVHVTIAWCHQPGDRADRQALNALHAAAHRSKQLAIIEVRHIDVSVLISDEHYIETNFPWLAHRGGPAATYQLYEGDLVRGRDLTDTAYDARMTQACTQATAIAGQLPAAYREHTDARGVTPRPTPEPRKALNSVRKNSGGRRQRRSQAIAQLEIGQQVTGPVKTVTDFGVFVGLGEIDGMIPTAKLAERLPRHRSRVISVGDTVTVKVVQIDPQRERVTLSLEKNLGPHSERDR